MTGASEDRFLSELSTEELELAVLELLLAKWSLSSCPLEAVHDWSFQHVELLLVDFTFNSVVNQHV